MQKMGIKNRILETVKLLWITQRFSKIMAILKTE
jgi:hypothetical protein